MLAAAPASFARPPIDPRQRLACYKTDQPSYPRLTTDCLIIAAWLWTALCGFARSLSSGAVCSRDTGGTPARVAPRLARCLKLRICSESMVGWRLVCMWACTPRRLQARLSCPLPHGIAPCGRAASGFCPKPIQESVWKNTNACIDLVLRNIALEFISTW